MIAQETEIIRVNNVGRALTRKELVAMGLGAAYGGARAAVKGRNIELSAHGPGAEKIFAMPLFAQWQWAIAGEWARCAFPVITMGHTYGAALLRTSPRGIDVRAPWRAFLVQAEAIPGVRSVLVYFDGTWTMITNCESGQINTFFATTEELARGEPADDQPFVHADFSGQESVKPLDTQDERMLKLASLLVLNSCIAMTDSGAVRRLGIGGKRHKQRTGSMPEKQRCQIYEIGRPIKVDCRQWVADYVAGRASTMRYVQWLRRGHWRHQACGPQLSERRLQWIEPTWMNRKSGGPILVRPHVLSDANPEG